VKHCYIHLGSTHLPLGKFLPGDVRRTGSRWVGKYNTFLDIMLNGPNVMNVDTKIRELLDDFNIVPYHRHKEGLTQGTSAEGGVGSSNFGL